ncbi:probable aminodeoxychorismate synthase, chloroplastic [Selaginella moellendorffii]|uniref:probable aminodeoxychorismate synthase, chloroplastic n=1 Tax=Selaginella moellendorffii TaxID=88036 RepID=UPI000D1C77F1|nr:probable aminodeoxychorismate synthase, chloroplastic [Selaginella moellendorffii]|eukprot:XP_024525152.1 probable aminodeoxychorismate synthase, chloroplastic [Selaginella moellendorffii]
MRALVLPPSQGPSPFFPSTRRADRIGDGRLSCARIGFSEYADKEECKLPGELVAQLKAERAETLNGASLPRNFKATEGVFQQGRPQEPDNKLSRSLRTLILDNYDSYTYNLFQLLSIVNGVAPVVLKNDELTFRELQRLLYEFDNVVISPGPGSPDRSSDIGVCVRLLQECHDIPILGVCMGHQALGYAHGMRIIHAPEPVHGRLSAIQHTHHPLFRNIPSGSGFKVVRYHSLILESASLPSSLIPTAWTLSEKPVPCGRTVEERRSLLETDETFEATYHSNSLLMGVSHKKWPHHGVQFHPESIATVHGRQLLENFAEITRCFLRANSRVRATTGALGRIAETFKPVARVPLRLCFKKLRSLETAVGGSENIFRVVYGRNSVENTFWLDSATADKNRCRFSYMGGKGGCLWQKITYCLSNDSSRGVLRVEDVNGDVFQKALCDGFFEFMNKETQRYSCRKEDYQQLPFEFVGGFVGYLGYELKCECGPLSNRHKSSVPDAAFFKADRFISIDHLTGDVYTVAVHEETRESTEAAVSWVEQTAEKIAGLSSIRDNSKCEKKYPEHSNNLTITENFTLSRTKDEYMDDVERCLKYIADGESYEVCLTAQMKRRALFRDPLELYSVLRRTNPAPYASWLHFGNEGPCVCSSSPERFLQLDRTGTLEAKPIKGTVPRGKSSLEDEMLRSQLRESEKDQAENLMIVDLLRNDLGRVCTAGSVHVPHLMAVETYSTVHTLVSTVRGKKRADVTPIDCVKAAFPGGSMTGAPKLRTMEILDAVETCPRGVYSGAIGFFSFSSSFDLSIVIRTLVIQGGEISLGAGGAIVALSDPESEYEEMLLKARAPTRAAEIASEGMGEN